MAKKDKLARYLQPATARERAALGRDVPGGKAPPGRCFGYVRVSTLQQADEGESLDVQQRQITGYAQMHGLTVDRMFIERGVSGSKPLNERLQGSELLSLLQPGDVVITPKLDRMFRSAIDALGVLQRLKDAGVSLHMIDLGGDTTGNGVSKLVFTILSAVAEAERDRTRERITDVKRDQRSRGRYLGGKPPYGFKVVGGALVPDAKQQTAIKRMVRLRQQGLSLWKITDRLNADGVKISHMGVKAALRRAAAAE